MSWSRLDDQFFNHQKVIDLPKDAKLLYLCALTHAAAQLTDGFISPGALRVVSALVDVDPRMAETLVEAELWERTEKGYQIHDYLEYNPSAENVRRDREAAKQRMKVKRTGYVTPEVQPNIQANIERSSAPPYPSPDPINVNEDDNVLSVEVEPNPAPYVPTTPVAEPPKQKLSLVNSEHQPNKTRPAPKPKRDIDEIRVLITSPPMCQWAAENTPFISVAQEADDFLDWLVSKNETRSDYKAAFRMWLRKAVKFSQQNRSNGNGPRATNQPDKLTARLRANDAIFDTGAGEADEQTRNRNVLNLQSRPAPNRGGHDQVGAGLGSGFATNT
jgi:hypothetical protein